MKNTKSGKSALLKNAIRFLVAAAAIYLAFRGENLREITNTVLGLSIWLPFAALALYIISQLVFVARWSVLLNVQNIHIGYWPAVKLHFLGLFYNNCLPGSVGGDLLRAWYVTRHAPEKKLEAAISVFVDRAIGLVAVFIMAFTGYQFMSTESRSSLWTPHLPQNDQARQLLNLNWVIAIFAALILAAAIFFLLTPQGRNFLKKSLDLVKLHGLNTLLKLKKAAALYYNHKPALFLTLLLSFVSQSVFLLALYMIGRNMGINADLKFYFIIFPISWLVGTIPITPGGGGIVEYAIKIMFVQLCMISGEEALALALAQRLLWLIGSLPGAVIHAAGFHMPKDFSVDYQNTIN